MTYNDIVDICSKYNELEMGLEEYLRKKNKINISSNIQYFDFEKEHDDFYIEADNSFGNGVSRFYINIEDFLDYMNGVK